MVVHGVPEESGAQEDEQKAQKSGSPIAELFAEKSGEKDRGKSGKGVYHMTRFEIMREDKVLKGEGRGQAGEVAGQKAVDGRGQGVENTALKVHRLPEGQALPRGAAA